MNTIDYRDYQLKKTQCGKKECGSTNYDHADSLLTGLPRFLVISNYHCTAQSKRIRNVVRSSAYRSVWQSSMCVTDNSYLRMLDFVLDAYPKYEYVLINAREYNSEFTMEEWKEAYSLTIDFIRAKHPGVKIHIVTGEPGNNEETDNLIVTLNELAKEIACEKGLSVIDMYQVAVDNRGAENLGRILEDTVIDVLCTTYGWTKSE